MRVLLFHMPRQGSNERHQQHRQADDDVGRMKANQRIERGAEEIGANRKPIDIDKEESNARTDSQSERSERTSSAADH